MGGVNVFFVISGYLITEILLKTKESKFYFQKFYFRRTLRIFPIYYLLVLFVLFYYFYKFRYFPEASLSLLTYTVNYFYSTLNDSYVFILYHAWTLAIEEQFYILWPLLIAIIPTKYLLKTSVILIVVAIFYRSLSVYIDGLSFIQLPAQIDSLLLGAIVAILRFNKWMDVKKAKQIKTITLFFGLIGLLSIFLSLSFTNNLNIIETYSSFGNKVDYTKSYFGIHTFFFIGVLSIGLVLSCLYDDNVFVRLLKNRVLVHFGKISYGLYLFHFPILNVVRFFFKDEILWIFFIGLVLTIIVSEISYFTIEKYFRNLKERIVFI